jgi:hypothetical protein
LTQSVRGCIPTRSVGTIKCCSPVIPARHGPQRSSAKRRIL